MNHEIKRSVKTLPGDWYYDEEIAKQEQQKIFAVNWSYICPIEKLTHIGDFVTGVIAGQSIVIVRNRNGDLCGYMNLCRHRASSLCMHDEGRLSQFTCPYHAWSYGLDGKLINAPGFKIRRGYPAW